jgi:sulfatase modifying factor 1
MVSRKNSWNGVGLSGIAFIGVILFALYFVSVSSPSAVALMPLGSSELCSKYSGLPDSWGAQSRSGMVHLSGGSFTLGTTLGYEEERQEIKTQVNDFWIDQTEVTVAQFTAFVKETGYITEAEQEGGAVVFRIPGAEELNQRSYAWWTYVKGANWRHPSGSGSVSINNHPVTLITLADAQAYANWLGRDLPTEVEWEYAAKAGHDQGASLESEPRDEKGKPIANFWQGNFPSRNTADDGYEGVAPVGCYRANDFKLYDMLGNVWEQTKDVYTESHRINPVKRPIERFAQVNQLMVIKGGSHLCGRDFCVRYRPSAREAHEANLPVSHIGFRTVLRDNESKSLAAFNPW